MLSAKLLDIHAIDSIFIVHYLVTVMMLFL